MFNLVIRTLIEGYLNICTATFLALVNISFSSGSNIFEAIFIILFLLLILFVPM
jgi:hypothetical protein